MPVMTMSLSLGGAGSTDINLGTSQSVLIQKFNIGLETAGELALKQEAEVKSSIDKIKAEYIDSYFRERGMPLEGTGMKMVLEAEKNGLDWRLLPAISVRESTGGKFACKSVKYSSFGWGSCKINFKSNDEGIETVARNLGGNNPNTDHHYAGKTTKEILQAYNPPSIVKHYAEQVMKIMDTIGPAEVIVSANS